MQVPEPNGDQIAIKTPPSGFHRVAKGTYLVLALALTLSTSYSTEQHFPDLVARYNECKSLTKNQSFR